ncbi:MAG: hypothetical protein NVSMB45_18400 [Ginsengibacter sp.]
MKKIDSKNSKNIVNKEKLRKAIEVLDALDNPVREKILKYLDAHPDSTVSNIIKSIRKVQSFVSKHLGILRLASFVTFQKSGKEVKYALNEQKIADTNKAIEMLIKTA